jgi:hypothetical protein
MVQAGPARGPMDGPLYVVKGASSRLFTAL